MRYRHPSVLLLRNRQAPLMHIPISVTRALCVSCGAHVCVHDPDSCMPVRSNRGLSLCDGLSVAGINVWTGCWGGSCRAKRCGRVCAETACRSTSGLAPSRAVTCVTCRVPISQSQGSARRDRGLRASCCALVRRAVRCIRTFTSLYYGAGAQNKLLYG